VPPARSTFASSMLSAPHIMPAMIVVSFPAGLTAPDLTRVLGSSTCSPINRERPVCSASSSTGTKPPADTRFRSSNTADSVLNLCDDCTGNAFPNTGHYDSDNRYCPSSEGIFAVHTPIKQPAHPRMKVKGTAAQTDCACTASDGSGQINSGDGIFGSPVLAGQ